MTRYGVHDDHYHTDFSEHRSGDTEGNIVGEYSVALPDGRVQHVKYTADVSLNFLNLSFSSSLRQDQKDPTDAKKLKCIFCCQGHYGGTVMEVSYQGKARHPEPVHIQPVVHEVVPSYHA